MYAEQLMSLGIVKEGQVINQDMELDIIRHGLKVKHARKVMKEMAMSSGEWVTLIGLSPRSLQRKSDSDLLTPSQSEKTLAIRRVVDLAVEYYEDRDTALDWLKTPQLAFGGKAAVDYLDTNTGIQYVENVLNRLMHGMTA
ncbi:MbcA/ParS/Xre antitoxin family protein [Grimontia kaedaensis]|uniref:MbcA/ParS/Xre antitoxin family protein n=1 Tax=Grimontia kaedaensis TaxID=2872157 RepID=A0ABY4X2X5_9GAMM|nr:antitoxin Xre/MbcA/ParS toxin-binding domain-containing protein [Grimontia kaedaensis]USH05594.1 MbcA/ParS/Xre antitoxin family protein [Grimontia kaedaensis]